MAGRVLGCCILTLLLYLTCVSAVQKLSNINDLKRIQFGQSVSRQGLLLLHWFANQVPNNRLNFNPNADYGSHHYGNYDDLLPQLPRGYRYYTVGNLDREGGEELPWDIQNNNNRARIIFRVCGQTIDRVYLTQHHNSNQGSLYDPNHTYEISTNLLRDVRQHSRSSLEQLCTFNIQLQCYSGQSSQSSNYYLAPVRQRGDTPSLLDTVKWVFLIIIVIIVMIIFLTQLPKVPH